MSANLGSCGLSARLLCSLGLQVHPEFLSMFLSLQLGDTGDIIIKAP